MALRIATRLPRLVILGVVLLLASATLAVGAAKRLTAVPSGAPAPVAVATLVVPDVSGQAFVFAKGSLEDTGFAWQVIGSVHGYAVNKIASQSPHTGARYRRSDHHRDFEAHRLSGEGESRGCFSVRRHLSPTRRGQNDFRHPGGAGPRCSQGSADEADNEEGRTEGGCSDQAPAGIRRRQRTD